MNKYQFVGEKRSHEEHVHAGLPEESIVWIKKQGKPRGYISYSMNLFEEGAQTIMLKAMGRAINKAVTIAEILKRKIPLYQVNRLTASEIIEVFEPLEEGLDVIESKRYVSCMTIQLSISNEGIDENNIGYQPPLSYLELQDYDNTATTT